jgi:predicted transcriptional regulator of viral defense system
VLYIYPYVLPDSTVTEHHSLVEACKRVPKGVVCLLFALRYHELTTQAPFEIWLAIGEKAWRPRVEFPPLRIVRFSQPYSKLGLNPQGCDAIHAVSVRKG